MIRRDRMVRRRLSYQEWTTGMRPYTPPVGSHFDGLLRSGRDDELTIAGRLFVEGWSLQAVGRRFHRRALKRLAKLRQIVLAHAERAGLTIAPCRCGRSASHAGVCVARIREETRQHLRDRMVRINRARRAIEVCRNGHPRSTSGACRLCARARSYRAWMRRRGMVKLPTGPKPARPCALCHVGPRLLDKAYCSECHSIKQKEWTANRKAKVTTCQ